MRHFYPFWRCMLLCCPSCIWLMISSVFLVWLYTCVFLILQVFRECFRETHHKIWNTIINFSYFIWILCFINAAKNKLQNHLTFCVNAKPGVKCCEMWKAKKGCEIWKKVTQNTPLHTFIFRISRVFLRNTLWNTEHSLLNFLYFMWILCFINAVKK